MADLSMFHPLAQRVIEIANVDDFVPRPEADGGEIDKVIREYLAPPTHAVESGVRFPDHPDIEVAVEATFIQSGNQLQMALIGSEPVLLVQPEYDAGENRVTMVVTSVDLPAPGLVQTLEALLDAARQIADQQRAED